MKLRNLMNPAYVYERREHIMPFIKSQAHRLTRPVLNLPHTLAAHGFPVTANDRKLAAFKDKHKGQIAFLIGNGPSVRIQDLERLQDRVTFCCNRFYLAYDTMGFRPTYTVSADIQMIEDFGEEIVNCSEGTVFLVSNRHPNLPGDYIWIRSRWMRPIVFSEQIYDHVMPGGGTLVAAIQVGYFMGITRFILYGVDHDFKFTRIKTGKDDLRSAYGDGSHFIQNYRSGKPWTPPMTEYIEESLQICDQFLRSKNGWVMNATRGGKLEVLERIDFDEVARFDQVWR